MSTKKVDLAAAPATRRAIVAAGISRYNGNKIRLAKTKGEFVLYSDPDADDLFRVLEEC